MPDTTAQFVPIQPGDVTLGLWCHTCQLPSAVTYNLYALHPDGPRQVAHLAGCPDCSTPTTEQPHQPPPLP